VQLTEVARHLGLEGRRSINVDVDSDGAPPSSTNRLWRSLVSRGGTPSPLCAPTAGRESAPDRAVCAGELQGGAVAGRRSRASRSWAKQIRQRRVATHLRQSRLEVDRRSHHLRGACRCGRRPHHRPIGCWRSFLGGRYDAVRDRQRHARGATTKPTPHRVILAGDRSEVPISHRRRSAVPFRCRGRAVLAICARG
jgi:hypothetical protein